MASDEQHEQTWDKAHGAPPPDHPSKPESPPDVHGPTWKYVAKRSWLEFSKDECSDLAAALTYFAALSMMPGLLAAVSMLGVVGQGEQTTRSIVGFLNDNAPEEVVSILEGPISQLTSSTGAGLAVVGGIVGALWTASGYVGAFGRAMNRIYEVGEGRPIWKLRPIMLLITLVLVVLTVVMIGILFLSGPVAEAVADAIGLGETGLTIWGIAKWPVLLVMAVGLIALLYHATPNVKQPKFRWLTVGSVIALVAMAVAGALFGFYVSNFSSYNATYGIIGSVIVLLLGLWILNMALLFGAEVDAELERGRQLQAGIEAEETIQLPPRDTRQVEKRQEKTEALVERGRELRTSAGNGSGSEHQRAAGRDSDEGDGNREERRGVAGGSPRH
jgi:membrane protein